jgi:hypothetical protein
MMLALHEELAQSAQVKIVALALQVFRHRALRMRRHGHRIEELELLHRLPVTARQGPADMVFRREALGEGRAVQYPSVLVIALGRAGRCSPKCSSP